MASDNSLLEKVAEIYDWLDERTCHYSNISGGCKSCGRCCDFDNFAHRLFVTSPEVMYLAANLGGEKIEPMPTGRCPYNVGGKCTVYEHRFSGCRIFYCVADMDFQSSLSESALKKLKLVCREYEIPYLYGSLAEMLNSFAGG